MSTDDALSFRLKELRKQKDMTQKEFSEFIGISQQVISGYERRAVKPSLEVIKEIAQKCNVSIDWLCGLTDQRYVNNSIKSYTEIIEFLYRLDCTNGTNMEILEFPLPDMPAFGNSPIEKIPVIAFNNLVLCTFLSDLGQMIELRNKSTIKRGLYDLWLKQQKEDYDRPIDPTVAITDYYFSEVVQLDANAIEENKEE